MNQKFSRTEAAIRYSVPQHWIRYDPQAVFAPLVEVKARVQALTGLPYQRTWVEELQAIQLKREVAGTSRIEGADFTERELDAALGETPAEHFTRSQRQARAAVRAYGWIAQLPSDRPVDGNLIQHLHRLIVTNADDDHCPPGQLRQQDQNVTFGAPRHRGVAGGAGCAKAFAQLIEAAQGPYSRHDPLIQALALHYHFAAMHPFLDGNGRTARALEALMLQRAGLRDALFIAMSNYYYDEKNAYLATLAEARQRNHDLTPFLAFGLKGVALQCERLSAEIRTNVSKALFRDLMYDLFRRLQSKRKRVIAQRQIEILKLLLREDSMELRDLITATRQLYGALKNPVHALGRDLRQLEHLKAVAFRRDAANDLRWVDLRLEWPAEITETAFFEQVKNFPQAKTSPLLP